MQGNANFALKAICLEEQSSHGHGEAHGNAHDGARKLSLGGGTGEGGDGRLDLGRRGCSRAWWAEGVGYCRSDGDGAGARGEHVRSCWGGRAHGGDGVDGPGRGGCGSGGNGDGQSHGGGDWGVRDGHNGGGEAVRASVRVNGPDPWCGRGAWVDRQGRGGSVSAGHEAGVVPVGVAGGPDGGGHGRAMGLAGCRDWRSGGAGGPVEPWLISGAGAAGLDGLNRLAGGGPVLGRCANGRDRRGSPVFPGVAGARGRHWSNNWGGGCAGGGLTAGSMRVAERAGCAGGGLTAGSVRVAERAGGAGGLLNGSMAERAGRAASAGGLINGSPAERAGCGCRGRCLGRCGRVRTVGEVGGRGGGSWSSRGGGGRGRSCCCWSLRCGSWVRSMGSFSSPGCGCGRRSSRRGGCGCGRSSRGGRGRGRGGRGSRRRCRCCCRRRRRCRGGGGGSRCGRRGSGDNRNAGQLAECCLDVISKGQAVGLSVSGRFGGFPKHDTTKDTLIPWVA